MPLSMAPRARPNAIDCVGPAGALNIDSLAQPGSKLRRIRLYLPILVVGPVSPEVSGHRFVANANGSALVPLGIGVDPRVLAVGQPFEVAVREGAVAAHPIPDRVQDGLVEDRILDGDSVVLLRFPQLAHNGAHVPCGDRFDEERFIEGRQMMALAVIEQFVELLDPDPRQAPSQFGGYLLSLDGCHGAIQSFVVVWSRATRVSNTRSQNQYALAYRQSDRGAHGVDSSESGVRHESIERGRLEPSRDLVHMRAEKPSSPSFSSAAHKSREFGGVRSMRSHAASSPT